MATAPIARAHPLLWGTWLLERLEDGWCTVYTAGGQVPPALLRGERRERVRGSTRRSLLCSDGIRSGKAYLQSSESEEKANLFARASEEMADSPRTYGERRTERLGGRKLVG